MTTRLGRIGLVVLAASMGSVWFCVRAQADSVIGTYSHNGPFLVSEVLSGFKGAGSVAADFGSDSHFLGGVGPTGSVTANHTQLPASSTVAKDKATGQTTVDFSFGAPFGPAANDTVVFHLLGIGSAVDAHNTAGNPAAAQVTDNGQLQFFIDPFGVPPGTLVGNLMLEAVPALGPFETVQQVDVYQDSIVILSLGPGSPASAVPLIANHSYQVRANYMMEVPFGVDPQGSFDYSATIAPVPEPACLALLGGMGLILCAGRGRQR